MAFHKGLLGLLNTVYPVGTEHGLELNPAGGGESDVITLASNDQTVAVDWRSDSSADDTRIITLAASPVPEPGTAILPLLLTGRLFARRRRRHVPLECY